MPNYSYSIAWSEADGEYVATSPEFPGLSGLALDAEGAVEILREAIVVTVAADARMEYKGYVAAAEFDESVGELVGRVVDLKRDGIHFRAERAADVEREFHISVDVYLEGCVRDGVEPEEPDGRPDAGR